MKNIPNDLFHIVPIRGSIYSVSPKDFRFEVDLNHPNNSISVFFAVMKSLRATRHLRGDGQDDDQPPQDAPVNHPAFEP